MSNPYKKDKAGDWIIINGRHYTITILGTDRMCIDDGWKPFNEMEIDFSKEISRTAIDENRSANERAEAWKKEVGSLVLI